jgi:hypothetical protein
MPRPPKKPELRMCVDLRIPVTVAQKEAIIAAASMDQSDMAAWVRPLLLEAAQSRIAKSKKARNRKR